MSSAPSLTWPGSRVLAGWWPMLERRQPCALFLHHLLLHRVEALVTVAGSPLLARFQRLLLESLSYSPIPDALGLDPALLSRLLTELADAGLVRREGTDWEATPEGRAVLESGRPLSVRQERRTFYFLDADPPRYLALEHPPCEPWPGGSERPFDPRALHVAIARADDWKQENAFPLDVQALVEDGPEWRRVIVDRPERLTILSMISEDDHLLAFAVQPSTWQLHGDLPVCSLGPSWRETLPDPASTTTSDDWRQAWRAWGQPRGLPMVELEACHLERVGMRLRVRAPRPLVERLRAARSDSLKGEAWLLAGSTEYARTLALIDLRDEV